MVSSSVVFGVGDVLTAGVLVGDTTYSDCAFEGVLGEDIACEGVVISLTSAEWKEGATASTGTTTGVLGRSGEMSVSSMTVTVWCS